MAWAVLFGGIDTRGVGAKMDHACIHFLLKYRSAAFPDHSFILRPIYHTNDSAFAAVQAVLLCG